MIYLDSAAVVKMIRDEAESPSLVNWLNGHSNETLVSSALIEVEVPRAMWRGHPRGLAAVASTIGRLVRIEMDAAVRATAGAYVNPHLRSLDAIHLATAEHLVASDKHVRAFVTYDKRLAAAAAEAGLPVVAPGAGD